jgi:hypothetical protein
VINWFSLLFNSFWIVGLAIGLAALSYQFWEARQSQTSLRIQLGQPSFLASFWAGFGLVCVGLAGTTAVMWETAVWLMMATAGFFFMAKAIRIRLWK